VLVKLLSHRGRGRFQAAIGCIGSLCARFSWREYKTALTHFLNCKPTEAPHQKQRVKVLAAILNAFHFVGVEGAKTSERYNIFKLHVSVDILLEYQLLFFLGGVSFLK
jgi:hypothetical protein